VTDLREVFEMATRNIEPNLHEWNEQERRQRRVARNRRIGAISLSAALAVVVGLFVLRGLDATDQGKETNKVAGRPATLPSEPGVYLFDLETKQATRVPGIGPAMIQTSYRAFSGIVSPDGSMVAYQGTDPEGKQVIYVANIDGTDIRALEKTATTAPDELGGLWFSPNGSQIAYQVRPYGSVGSEYGEYVGDLFLVDVATGETTRLTHLKPVSSDLWYMGPTFSPDGQSVFFTLPNRTYRNYHNRSWNLWSVPASGGEPRLVLRDAIGARFSPDGRTVVYFKHFKPSPEDPLVGDMWLADADGTDARRLEARGGVFSARWSPDGTRICYIAEGRAGHVHVYLVDLTTGEISKVLKDADDSLPADWPEWVDDRTWIIGVE
jgi:Tol biopolymer transport system component